MAKDDNDGKSWDRMREMFSRLPQAIAAAIINAQAKPVGISSDSDQQTNAVNAPQQPQANPAANFAASVRAMLPSMARYFDRADHATAGGISTQQPFIPTVFKPQHTDFGKVDWSDVIGRAVARVVQVSPKGPGAAVFRPQSHGDVNVDMADARAQRLANASIWGDPFGAHAKRKAADDALVAHVATRTVVGSPFTPKPPTFNQTHNTPISKWTRISANAKAWARSAGANTRYAAKRAWQHAKGNRYGTGQRVPSSMGHWMGRNIPRAASGAARMGKAAGSAMPRAFMASMNAAATSLKMVAATSSTMLGGIMMAANVLQRSTDFVEQRTQSNKRFATFNPVISHAYAQLELGDVRRNMAMSVNVQESTVSLVHATDRMRDSFRDWDKMTIETGNRIAGFGAGALGALGQSWAPIAQQLTGQLPSQKGSEQAGRETIAGIQGEAAYWASMFQTWGDKKIAESARQIARDAALAPPAPIIAPDTWAKGLQDFAKTGPYLPKRTIKSVKP